MLNEFDDREPTGTERSWLELLGGAIAIAVIATLLYNLVELVGLAP